MLYIPKDNNHKRSRNDQYMIVCGRTLSLNHIVIVPMVDGMRTFREAGQCAWDFYHLCPYDLFCIGCLAVLLLPYFIRLGRRENEEVLYSGQHRLAIYGCAGRLWRSCHTGSIKPACYAQIYDMGQKSGSSYAANHRRVQEDAPQY